MSNNENNKNDGFGRGITLILIGVFALMVTFFDYEIDWHIMGQLWPLLLIIIGVCVMPINRWIKTAVSLLLLVFGFVIYQNKLNDDTEKVYHKTEIITRFSDDDD